jgi:hypothetical protein
VALTLLLPLNLPPSLSLSLSLPLPLFLRNARGGCLAPLEGVAIQLHENRCRRTLGTASSSPQPVSSVPDGRECRRVRVSISIAITEEIAAETRSSGRNCRGVTFSVREREENHYRAAGFGILPPARETCWSRVLGNPSET